jgi:hypothetical protein
MNLAPVIDVTLEIGDLADRITITSEAPYWKPKGRPRSGHQQ